MSRLMDKAFDDFTAHQSDRPALRRMMGLGDDPAKPREP